MVTHGVARQSADYTYLPRGATLASRDEARMIIERWSPDVRSALATTGVGRVTISDGWDPEGASIEGLEEFSGQIHALTIPVEYRGGLDVLYRLSRLDDLQTSHPATAIDFSRLEALRECFLTDSDSLGNIGEATNLTSLALMRMRMDSLASLHRLVGLRSLFISGAHRLRSLRGVEALPLREVRLRYLSVLESIASLVGNAPVTVFELRNCPKVTDAEVVGRIRTLEHVVVVKARLQSLQCVLELENVTVLAVSQTAFGGNTVSCRPLARLAKARDLRISDIKTAVDLAAIGELTALEYLVIVNCGSMTSLDWLSGLSNLRTLELGGLKVANQSLAPIRALPKLQIARIASLTPRRAALKTEVAELNEFLARRAS